MVSPGQNELIYQISFRQIGVQKVMPVVYHLLAVIMLSTQKTYSSGAAPTSNYSTVCRGRRVTTKSERAHDCGLLHNKHARIHPFKKKNACGIRGRYSKPQLRLISSTFFLILYSKWFNVWMFYPKLINLWMFHLATILSRNVHCEKGMESSRELFMRWQYCLFPELRHDNTYIISYFTGHN